MSELEQQIEEIEALTSIYEGDLCFKQINSTTFQYKVKCLKKYMNNKIFFYKFQYGEEDSAAFIVQIIWGKL